MRKKDNQNSFRFYGGRHEQLRHGHEAREEYYGSNLTGNARLEIVCHGPGLDMLEKNRTTVQNEIAELNKLNVVFAACEVTMKRRGVDKSQLVPNVITVPAAILEISSKEQDGWSYVKESH
jgi:intracellular sulfur oxidation DsrE/DsrF family protein